MSGAPKKYYMVELLGNLHGTETFFSFNEALLFVSEQVCGIDTTNDWEEDVVSGINVATDRILIWEVEADSSRKVLWHFSGWNWNQKEFNLPQGRLPGHDRSLYVELLTPR